MRLFDSDTALTDLGGGQYRAEAPAIWAIDGHVNGGWTMATAARAAILQMPHGDPLVATGYYLAPIAGGEVELSVAVLNRARSTSTATVAVAQGGQLCGHFTVAATDFAHVRGDNFEERTAPVLPPVEQCLRLTHGQGPDLSKRVGLHYPPDHIWWNPDEILGKPGYDCWVLHADEAPLQPLDMLMFVDCVPPGVFAMLGPIGWVPTIELSVQVRRPPVGNRLRARVRSRSLSNGLTEEDVELWDESDQLIALSRQLLKVRRLPPQ